MPGNTEVGVVARIPGENDNVGDSLAASKADSMTAVVEIGLLRQ